MKVGDYVRTLDGIMKVIECRDNRFVNEDGNVYFYSDMMCNPSSNIIDLIEKGDYVNGSYVLDFESLITGEKAVIVDGLVTYGWGQGVIPASEIKSIVTCEQFEAMEYKVNEE